MEYLRADSKRTGRVAQIEHLPSRHQGKTILSEPANIFIAERGVVKLGDMNVSKITERGFCMTQTGTPYYASPEVWKDEPYDEKSDIWSLGCVLYELITLKPPFRAEDMEGLFKKVTRGIYQRLPS